MKSILIHSFVLAVLAGSAPAHAAAEPFKDHKTRTACAPAAGDNSTQGEDPSRREKREEKKEKKMKKDHEQKNEDNYSLLGIYG